MLFKWLTGVFTGRKKRNAEICNLKKEIHDTVDRCRSEAAAGNRDAVNRLYALEQTIKEQSVRMLRGSAKPKL